MNDVDRSLCDIQASPEHLREQMVVFSKNGYRRSRARGWITRMRFLILSQHCGRATASPLPEIDSSEAQPHVSAFAPHLLDSCGNFVYLAGRAALKDASAYVAVSYCWNREHTDWFPRDSDKPLQVICEDLSRRPSNAPSDVLYRSMAYARARNVNAIWIDQECIDQNDGVEKAEAIQEMDLVYQEADHAIAVLEYYFQTQSELDVFASVCDLVLYSFDPSQIEVLESVLFALTNEEWFERAWTLQESVSAGESMILLLGCPGLQKAAHFGLTPGEFEISIFDFQQAMVNTRIWIEEGLAASIWPDPSSAIITSNYADILWNHIPTTLSDIFPDTLKIDTSHRQGCNAAQALTFLDDRLNSFFPDRLAILANLCDYEYRIKPEVLELSKSSFSICVHTLAILNGDMSLLDGYIDEANRLRVKDAESDWDLILAEDRRSEGLVYHNDDYDLQSNAYGFSWGPKPSACLDNITYLEENAGRFRLKPAILSIHGLRVCGVLWDVNHTITVLKTHKMFAPRWQEEVAFQKGESVFEGHERQKPLVQDFFWTLLHELIELGFCELSRTIWSFVQPLREMKLFTKYESLGAPLPYSYDMVFGHLMRDSTANQHLMYDEQEVRGRIYAPALNFDPEFESADRPLLERVLIEQVCKDGAIVCGAPMGFPPNKEPYVWFEACKMGDQVFTPVTDLSDTVAHWTFSKQALSWRVLATGQSANDCSILHCVGRRRGFWRLEGLNHQEYILD